MATTEDYKKYFCALGCRSVRRVAAKMHAVDLDTEVRSALMKETRAGCDVPADGCRGRLAAR